jgi:hypothetical protein
MSIEEEAVCANAPDDDPIGQGQRVLVLTALALALWVLVLSTAQGLLGVVKLISG